MAKPKRCVLSFEDEVQDTDDDVSQRVSMAEATARRFKKPRQRGSSPSPTYDAKPAPTSSSQSRSQEEDRPIRSQASQLAAVYFGVARSPGPCPYMQDRHIICHQLLSGTSGSFAAVYDGHVGSSVAQLASERLHTLLLQQPAILAATGVTSPPDAAAIEERDVAAALKRCMLRLDNEALAMLRKSKLNDGSTAVCVLQLGRVLYLANVGDSRAVLGGTAGARRLTRDHRADVAEERRAVAARGGVCEYIRQAEKWAVVRDGGYGRPGRMISTTRALGDIVFKEPTPAMTAEPDVFRAVLGAADRFVVLASDGLWDVLSDAEAVDAASKVMRTRCSEGGAGDGVADAMAQELVDKALAWQTPDNVTAVVMLLDWK